MFVKQGSVLESVYHRYQRGQYGDSEAPWLSGITTAIAAHVGSSNYKMLKPLPYPGMTWDMDFIG